MFSTYPTIPVALATCSLIIVSAAGVLPLSSNEDAIAFLVAKILLLFP